MLSEPRERKPSPRVGCALVSMLIGFVILSMIGAWVVTATVWGWIVWTL